ncbi:MAG: N-acetylmuramoyl-L-alanine amidase [Magnetococcus sp. YQC-5]
MAHYVCSMVLMILVTFFPVEGWAVHCNCQDFKVAIDIGHSTSAPGATSARGRPELDFNLTMGTMILEQLFKQGFKNPFSIVNPPNLKARVRIAEEKQADLFVAIHHDSVQSYYLKNWEFNGKRQKYCDAFRGYSILVSTRNLQFEKSFAFAKMVGKNFREAGYLPAYHHSKKVIGGRHNMLDEELGIYQFDNLVVLRETTMPAVLIEFGVIVHREEELLLEQEETKQKMMQSVVEGIRQFRAVDCMHP